MLPTLHTPARAVVLAALLGASALAVPTAVRAQSVTAERALMSSFPPSQPGTLAALAHAQVTHVPADRGLIDALKPPSEPATPSVRLPFEATLAGARNGSTVWEGRLRGDASAPVELTLHQVESPVQAANPVWHVRGQWTVAGLSPARSFTAELEGIVDWKTGATHLSGVVTSGWMKGAWVQQEGRFVNADVSGTVEVLASGRYLNRSGASGYQPVEQPEASHTVGLDGPYPQAVRALLNRSGS